MASLSAGLQGQLFCSVGTLRVQQADTKSCGRNSGDSVPAAAATPSSVQQTAAAASRAGCWSSSAGLRHYHEQQQPGHTGLLQQRSFLGGESVRAMFSVSRFPASSSTLAASQSLSRHATSPLTVCQSIPRNTSTSTSAGAAIPATTPATTAGGSSGSSTSSSAVVSPERSASSFTQPAAAAAYNFDEDSLSEDDEDVRLFDSDVDSDDEDDVKEVVHVDAAQEPGDELRVTNLGLSEVIVKGLQRRGIERLFPIQHAVMRPSMEGRDIIARAKTGTGKTLAFGIPILERIVREQKEMGSRMSRNPRCLVLAPTRELAKQVEREFMETLPAPTLRTVCVYGGVSIEAQIKELRRGVDCVVGTPGRIIDLIDRGSLKLADVQYVVLDEADQMLAVGFEEDVERIMEGLPGQEDRQTCLFSATMPGWVRKLSRKYLNNPLTIDLVGEQEDKIAENIRLMCVRTPNSAKKRILTDLIAVHGKNAKTIVFTQTKRDADEVAESLSAFAGCEALHGDIAQQQRERTLQSFRDGRFSVLVATDVAARGLDIPNVDLVIHYEIPNDPETFVHRSGRTGRAGKSGSAILMYTDTQTRTLRLIERDVGHKLDRISPPHVDEVLRASADRAVEAIESVHPELADVFMEAAEKLLADKGPLALAAAIAHVSGFNKPPASKSLLTHEEGFVTVRIVRTPRSRNPPLATPRSVLGTLSEIYRPAADSVGKIRMLRRGTDEGAVFDLPEAVAKELLRIDITNGDVLDVPKELPAIEEDEREREGDRYGRRDRGGRDRGGRGGSFRDSGRDRDDRRGGGRFGDRGGFRSDVDRFSRGGDRFGDRDDGFRSRSSGGSDRSGRAPLRRSLSTTTSSSSSSIGVWSRDAEGAGGFSSGDSDRDSWSSPADWSGGRTGGRLERRDEGGYERGRRVVGGAGGLGRSGGFGGVCFLCKQPGHRAADCPMVGGS